MNSNEIVEAYLQSLQLEGQELDFKFLNELVSRHVATFAFSSVRCWLGDELPIDFESLYSRVVVNRYGGYCFEQNGLLYRILEELGFAVDICLARVIFNQDTHPPLTHRITILTFEDKQYVMDVGFGAQGPRIAVPMSSEEAVDGEKKFRVVRGQFGEYHMQVLKRGKFFSLYRFDLVRYGQSDCELGHFYSHRHPDATFVKRLVASVILESEVRSLVGLEYWVIGQHGTNSQKITEPEKLWHLLVHELGIQLTREETLGLYNKLMT